MRNSIVLFFIVVTCCSSCVPFESLVNFSSSAQIPEGPQSISNFDPLLIQYEDQIEVVLTSSNGNALKPFTKKGASEEEFAGVSNDLFKVDEEGNINFPSLGSIKVKGMTCREVEGIIQDRLKDFFQSAPTVDVHITNFKISVTGEVRRPGSIKVENEKISVLEAINLAGDFTDYARRDSVIIIREMDGYRHFKSLDFNSYEVFNDPDYYLKQNDVVYVQTSKLKLYAVRDPATKYLPWVTAVVSVAALLISIIR